jgi:hypothetical protein
MAAPDPANPKNRKAANTRFIMFVCPCSTFRYGDDGSLS